MGSQMSKLDGVSPGDKAFDAGDEEYRKYKGIDESQKNSPDAQVLLEKAIKSYNFSINYYRKTKDLNLGPALLNLATVKSDMYRSANETEPDSEHKISSASANLLEEIIKLDDEALSLWRARQPKPPYYPTLLANLAALYRERFTRNKQSADMQQAIKLYEDICGCTEKITKPHIEAVMELGSTYWTWHCDPSNIASRKDEQLRSAIRYLRDANDLCQDGYTDIRSKCLYTLARINHHRFEEQEKLRPPNPTPDYLNNAIHFYRSTLQIGSPPNDPRYPKALWFILTLLFHRYYEGDKQERDLQEAQKWAQEALDFPGITDTEQRKVLTTVRDYDPAIDSERKRGKTIQRGNVPASSPDLKEVSSPNGVSSPDKSAWECIEQNKEEHDLQEAPKRTQDVQNFPDTTEAEQRRQLTNAHEHDTTANPETTRGRAMQSKWASRRANLNEVNSPTEVSSPDESTSGSIFHSATMIRASGNRTVYRQHAGSTGSLPGSRAGRSRAGSRAGSRTGSMTR